MAQFTHNRQALIVASYQYQDPDLRQLVAPAQDAQTLARVLKAPAIGGFEVQTLLNEPAHKINQAIETFFTDRKRDDLLLLYFSGHGIKDDWGRLYFATTDTHYKTLRTTAIPASFINDVMNDNRSRQVLLLDCCYSGAFARTKADKIVGIQEQVGGRGRVVLTSSNAVQYSFEGDEIKGEGVHSIFTRVLVRGLETGEADRDRDGHISLDELYEYVYDHVVDETPKQRPQMFATVEGKIFIARNPNLPLEETPPASRVAPSRFRTAVDISLVNKIRKSAADLLSGLRLGTRRVSRRTALLGVLVLVLGLSVLFSKFVWPLSVPDDVVQVGVAEFVGCSQISDALPSAIAPQADEITFTSLDEIQDSSTARTYTDLDLVIWGQCTQTEQLVMHLDILTSHGPEELAEIESITAHTSALDPDRAARLSRAAINYLHGNYDEAIGSLTTLQQEARTPSEQAELAFLQANSLLFAKRYDKALDAYDRALEYDQIQAQVYNNRGVAGMNWALQLEWWDYQPSDTQLQVAVDDLTRAIEISEDARITALAYLNRGMARSLVASDYDQALIDCEQAIAQAPELALGYVCRAGAYVMPLLQETTCDLSNIQLARDDLASAYDLSPGLADIFFWRGYVAFHQAEECDTTEQDRQKHWQDAKDDVQVFLELMDQQPVKLAVDRYMLEVYPLIQ
jgi:tetratricopeptide (TPR) repeat protein